MAARSVPYSLGMKTAPKVTATKKQRKQRTVRVGSEQLTAVRGGLSMGQPVKDWITSN